MRKLGYLIGKTLEMREADPEQCDLAWDACLADPHGDRFRPLFERPIGTLQRKGLAGFMVSRDNMLWQLHSGEDQPDVLTCGPLSLSGRPLVLMTQQDVPCPQWFVWSVDERALVAVLRNPRGEWVILRKTEYGEWLATHGDVVTYVDRADDDRQQVYRMHMGTGMAIRVLEAQDVEAVGDWLVGSKVVDDRSVVLVWHPHMRELAVPGKLQKSICMQDGGRDRLLVVVDTDDMPAGTIRELPHDIVVMAEPTDGYVGDAVWLDGLWYVRHSDFDTLIRDGEVLRTGPEQSMRLLRTSDDFVVCVIYDRTGSDWTAKVFDRTGRLVGEPDPLVGRGSVRNWPRVLNRDDEPVQVIVRPEKITFEPDSSLHVVSAPFNRDDAVPVQAYKESSPLRLYTVWRFRNGTHAVFGPKGMCGLFADKVITPLFIAHGMLCWYVVNGDVVSAVRWPLTT